MDFAALNRLDLNAPAFVPSEERAAAGARGSEQQGGGGRQRKADAKAKEVCRNFQAGRCNRGDKCQRRHVAGHGRKSNVGGKPSSSLEEKVAEGSRSSSAPENKSLRGSNNKKSKNSKSAGKSKSSSRSKKKNTESFNPEDYLLPPDIRVRFGSPTRRYNKPYSVHDVVVTPNLFCKEDDYSVYDDLLSELKASGCDSLFVSWHGDSHVIADDKKMRGSWKKNSPTIW